MSNFNGLSFLGYKKFRFDFFGFRRRRKKTFSTKIVKKCQNNFFYSFEFFSSLFWWESLKKKFLSSFLNFFSEVKWTKFKKNFLRRFKRGQDMRRGGAFEFGRHAFRQMPFCQLTSNSILCQNISLIIYIFLNDLALNLCSFNRK